MKLRKFFGTLSGDDYSIISECGTALQNRFAAIGAFVFIVFALCFISSYFTFTRLFQNYFTGIPAALFFAFMITNIYLLLLYTLSKNVLPHTKNIAAQTISTGFRLLFICFIAIVVSKPLEAFIFSARLSGEISQYKQEQLQKYTAITSEHFDNETKQLKEIIESRKRLYGDSNDNQTEKYQLLINQKDNQKRELLSEMESLVQNSNYYVQSIVILNTKFPACWLLTLLMTAIFIIPAYLKYFIPKTGLYYIRKQSIETRLILEEYALFKAKYIELFRVNHNADKAFSESFADAPFNTVRKMDNREFLEEDKLISELYNA